MKQIVTRIVIGILLISSLPVLAEEHRDRERRFDRERHFEGREIHRFHEHDLEIWRGGRWHHGRHEGQLGWWWIAGGIWYFYPNRIAEIPDPYTPPVVVIEQQPPVVVSPQAPVVVAPQTTAPAQPQPATQLWYYCASSKSYYPYVPSCPEGWKPVPAQPSPAAPR